MSLRLVVAVQAAIVTRMLSREDRGQATAEYALVIIGAALMAMLVIGCATFCFEHSCHNE